MHPLQRIFIIRSLFAHKAGDLGISSSLKKTLDLTPLFLELIGDNTSLALGVPPPLHRNAATL
jgi:hypothetical protein